MKRSLRKFIAAAGITLAVISFSGCSLLLEILFSALGSSDVTTEATKDESWRYQATNPVYEVDSTVKSVTISGLSKGQEIYISKTNPNPSNSLLLGYTEIPAIHTQYVKFTENVTPYVNATTNIAARSAEEMEAEISAICQEHKHYEAPYILPKDLPAPNRAVDSNPDYRTPVTQITQNIDTTTKYVYIDADANLSTYKLAKATLRAVGDYCFVWVVDGYFDQDKNSYGYYYEPAVDRYGEYTTPRSTGEKYTVTSKASSDPSLGSERVSRDFVETVADKFDTMYPLIRNVFGKESDQLYDYGNQRWIPMNQLSDTGTKVNIVVYDIGADHSKGNTTGVLGYFYSKDYFQNGCHFNYEENTVAKYSNEGKYFYVDAFFSKTDPEEMYSTLGHEFQHMVNFAQKAINNDLYPSTQFNEMLSMICEDIIIGKLGLSLDKGPYNRLPYFNGSYLYSGMEYREGLEVLSYATNYAFGAWLIRQFGGVPLISELSTCPYIDNDAIVHSVNKVNGTNYRYEDLLCMYTQACIYRSDPSIKYKAPTFNQARTYTGNSEYEYPDGITYPYPIRAINLFDLNTLMGTNESNYYMPTQDGTRYPYAYCKYDGPLLYSAREQGAIRPWGMMLSKVGSVQSSGNNTILYFGNTMEVSMAEKLYIIIK